MKMKAHAGHTKAVNKLVVVSLALVVMSILPAWAGKGNQDNPGIAPSQSKAYGKTYGEWAAAWWQWAMAIPADRSPLPDETGALAAEGQSGPVWFLAGVMNVSGEAHRSIQVPAGKALFFPVINTECSTLEVGTIWYGKSEQELRECAKGFADAIEGAHCYVDGEPVKNLYSYRAQSPVFELAVPDNNLLIGAGPAIGWSVADGIHLMLRPLPVGLHTIEFGGTTGGFTLHIVYQVEVVGR